MKNSTTPRRKAKKGSVPALDNGRIRIHPSEPFKYRVPDDSLAPYLFEGDEVELNPALHAKPGDIVLTAGGRKRSVLLLGHLLETEGGASIIDVGRISTEQLKVVAVHRMD